MKIDLNKEDLINMCKGIDPDYIVMKHSLIESQGSYSGSYDSWNWNMYSFKDYDEEQLIECYRILKTSWKNSECKSINLENKNLSINDIQSEGLSILKNSLKGLI